MESGMQEARTNASFCTVEATIGASIVYLDTFKMHQMHALDSTATFAHLAALYKTMK